MGIDVAVQCEWAEHRAEICRSNETSISIQRRFLSNSARSPSGSLRTTSEVPSTSEQETILSAAILSPLQTTTTLWYVSAGDENI